MPIFIRDLPEPELKELSDRQLLELTCLAVNSMKALLVLQETRIDSLERWRWIISGGLLVVMAMAGWILSRVP